MRVAARCRSPVVSVIGSILLLGSLLPSRALHPRPVVPTRIIRTVLNSLGAVKKAERLTGSLYLISTVAVCRRVALSTAFMPARPRIIALFDVDGTLTPARKVRTRDCDTHSQRHACLQCSSSRQSSTTGDYAGDGQLHEAPEAGDHPR